MTKTNGVVVDAACNRVYKDADTPEELTRWIWDKYVGVPVAGDAWGQEYENLLDRVRRMDRSSFTKGLHEGAKQMKNMSVLREAEETQVEGEAGERVCGTK